tara:strand:+ start:151 stop:1110 length:960 start_codon:yes stop_codon:yes gene_type:complete
MQNNLLNNKTILITGSSGYIGSKLLKRLEQLNVKIVALTKKKDALTNEKKNVEYVYGDISHNDFWKKIFLKYNFDYIFHLAALEYQGLNGSILKDLEINVKSTLILLDNINLLSNKPKIIFFSSVNIFGSIESESVTEESNPRPESYWSHHKILSQFYLEFYNKVYNIESLILILPNIYGFSQNLEVTMRMSVNKIISRVILNNEFTLYENCNIKRNFLYIDDLVEAIFSSLKIKKWNASKYLIGDNDHFSFSDIFRILKEVNKNIIKNQNPIQLDIFEMRNYKINVDKFKTETGWKTEFNFQRNIIKTYEDLLLNYGK